MCKGSGAGMCRLSSEQNRRVWQEQHEQKRGVQGWRLEREAEQTVVGLPGFWSLDSI